MKVSYAVHMFYRNMIARAIKSDPDTKQVELDKHGNIIVTLQDETSLKINVSITVPKED